MVKLLHKLGAREEATLRMALESVGSQQNYTFTTQTV